MDITKRSNLLLLRGINPADFIVTIAPIIAQTCMNAADRVNQYTAWTEMPKKFTSVATWPQFSNLQCWVCDQKPKGAPAFIPSNPECECVDGQPTDVCDVIGHFHDWHCAVTYVNEKFPADRRKCALKLISLFESKFSGKYKLIIMPSGEKTDMKQYCGQSGMTPEQWRARNEALDADYSLTQYKVEHFVSDI